MIWFRCYSCWHLTGYAGPKESIDCTQCGTILFAGALPMRTIHDTRADSEEHGILLHKLRVALAKNQDIHEGQSEFIAAEMIRHKPDAIYYRRDPSYAFQPIIYEVLTSNFVIDEDTISRYKLFAVTARNRFSQFYLAIPESREKMYSKEVTEKILKDNGILTAGIIVLGDESLK